jgi:hypothetical protein
MVFVDAVYGDNATGMRNRADLPFLTVTAALAAALSGDVVAVRPGVYSEPLGIVMPSGVGLRGAQAGAVTIQALGVTADTTLVTMGTNTRVEDVSLRLTSSGHFALVGVSLPGATSSTARLRVIIVEVDNGTAGAGSSVVTGIDIRPTTSPAATFDAVRAVTVSVNSTGSGAKRGILLSAAAGVANLRDVNLLVTKQGAGAGTYVGAECSSAPATLFLSNCKIDSPDGQDVAQTSGTLLLHAVSLLQSTADGKSFKTDSSYEETWAIEGAVPAAATNFFRVGSAAATATEIKRRISRACLVKAVALRARVAPGGGRTTTVTVRKNGVDTVVLASLSGMTTSTKSGNVSAFFAEGDDVSVKVVTDAGNGTTDLDATLEFY